MNRAVLWCLLMLIIVIDFARIVYQGLPIDGDIFSLLPQSNQQADLNLAIKRHQLSINNKIVFFVGGEDESLSRDAALSFENSLQSQVRSQLIDRFGAEDIGFVVNGINKPAAKLNGLGRALLYEYRYQFLDANSKTMLKENRVQSLVQNSMQLLYSPMSISDSVLLENDPQLLFVQYLQELSTKRSGFSLKDNWLSKDLNGKVYYFLEVNLGEKALTMDQQIHTVTLIRNLIKRVESQHIGVRVVTAGAIYHAAAGVSQGKREVSTVGVGSAIGVLALLIFVFRSSVPVVFSLSAIVAGSLAAFVVCYHVFGSVHVMALVFGASLIGVTIDYAFHYYSERNYAEIGLAKYKKKAIRATHERRAISSLKHVYPSIFLGMLTSVVAYLSMGIGPFHLMQQVALFSAIGLVTSFSCVVCLFPAWKNSAGLVTPAAKKYTNYILSLSNVGAMKYKHIILVIIGLMMVPGLMQLRPLDDVRLLQSSPDDIQQEEKDFFSIMGIKPAFQFFLVEGASVQAVLEKEEELMTGLGEMKKRGYVGGVRGITDVLPSVQKQRQNYLLRENSFLENKEQWSLYYQSIGFSNNQQQEFYDKFAQAKDNSLTFKKFQENAMFERVKALWVGNINDKYYSIVTLENVDDIQKLSAFANTIDGVNLIDQVGDFSRMLKNYRENASIWLLVAYGLIVCFFVFRYGIKSALLYMVPSIFAAWVALAVIGYSGQVFNIFNLFALILVLGIGIDYVLFFAENQQGAMTPSATDSELINKALVRSAPTMLSITLSAITTILSFGLLALSKTHAISGFGMTMLVGISVVYFLSPIYAMKSQGEL